MRYPTIELSYTAALAWSNGDVDAAMASFYRRNREATPAMEFGKEQHEKWDEFIMKNMRLPDELGGTPLLLPICENYQKVPLNEIITLKFVPDCVDFIARTVYEFKTGKTSASEYASGYQAVLYALALERLYGIEFSRAIYCHWNQHNGKSDRALIWISEEKKENALNWFLTIGAEIYEHVNKNQLFALT